GGDTPELTVSERGYWPGPVVFTLPGKGVLGRGGTLRADAGTGELLTDPQTQQEMLRRPEQPAQRAARSTGGGVYGRRSLRSHGRGTLGRRMCRGRGACASRGPADRHARRQLDAALWGRLRGFPSAVEPRRTATGAGR